MAKVTLINYTHDAKELLIFTKSTRLQMKAGLLDEIKSWSEEKKLAELEYMANTIPSSWEFVNFTFMIENTNRGTTHQMVRTRTQSYAQQTMRVLDMGGFTYDTGPRILENPKAQVIYDSEMKSINDSYQKLIEMGIPAEDARGLLPTNIHTNIVVHTNLRTMADIAKSRTGGRTQGDYADIANQMVDEVLKVYPWAEKFMFRNGRDLFKNLEALLEQVRGDDRFGNKLAMDCLKDIDQLRKLLN